jgi:hypothetical protein
MYTYVYTYIRMHVHVYIHVYMHMRWYNELVEYKRVHGDCSVPTQWAPNPKLGAWVNRY